MYVEGYHAGLASVEPDDPVRRPATLNSASEMTRSSLLRAGSGALLLACITALPALAQANGAAGGAGRSGGQPAYQIQPSGRAVTVIEIAQRVAAGTPADQRPAPKKVLIDYGQPHARGRDVGPLVPTTTWWRAGANAATTLTTEVDLNINGTLVPQGSYTLFVQRSANGAQLIVNKQLGQWGTAYDQKQDLARIDMRVRTLSQPLDALQIALVPTPGSLKGVLRMVWGTIEMETEWEAKP